MDAIDFNNPLVLVALGIVAFCVGQLLFKGDHSIDTRRRAATRLAGRLRELGFTRIPPILEDYSVGDYVGMVGKVRDVAELLGDEKERQAEFEKVFQLVLEAKMKDPDKRDSLVKAFDKLKALYVQVVAPPADKSGTSNAPAAPVAPAPPPTVVVAPIHVPVPAPAAPSAPAPATNPAPATPAPAVPNPGLS